MGHHYKHAITVFCLLLANHSFALPTDKNEKLEVYCKAAVYNFKTGVNVFEGDVKIDQGSSHILADKVITKSVNHELQEIIAYGYGKVAHYWTVPNVGDKPVHAKANIIKYYPKVSDMTLENNVLITQGKNSFQGKLIHYNSLKESIIVPHTNKGRAVMIYHPNS